MEDTCEEKLEGVWGHVGRGSVGEMWGQRNPNEVRAVIAAVSKVHTVGFCFLCDLQQV